MLLGLNLPEQPAFALILVGDPYLLSTLRLRSHRALYSRIAAHARIEGLSQPGQNRPEARSGQNTYSWSQLMGVALSAIAATSISHKPPLFPRDQR